MIYSIIVNLAGGLIFLFVLWKRLKEDYSPNLVFSTGFLVIVGIILSQVIALTWFRDWWFWFLVFGIVLTFSISIYRFKLRIFETLDAAVNGLSPWLLMVFLFSSVTQKNAYTLGAFFVILAVYLFYHFVNSQYKKFTWYPSGRVGFSGFVALAVFFLLRTLAGIYKLDMLSFVGDFDTLFSGVIAFLSFLGIFHLARQS